MKKAEAQAHSLHLIKWTLHFRIQLTYMSFEAILCPLFNVGPFLPLTPHSHSNLGLFLHCLILDYQAYTYYLLRIWLFSTSHLELLLTTKAIQVRSDYVYKSKMRCTLCSEPDLPSAQTRCPQTAVKGLVTHQTSIIAFLPSLRTSLSLYVLRKLFQFLCPAFEGLHEHPWRLCHCRRES